MTFRPPPPIGVSPFPVSEDFREFLHGASLLELRIMQKDLATYQEDRLYLQAVTEEVARRERTDV